MTALIKKRTAELEGVQLDWAVAMAGEEWKTAHRFYPTMTLDPTFAGVRIGEFGYMDGRLVCILIPRNPMRQVPSEFSPSSRWEYGGPIIEREGLVVAKFWEPIDGPITPGLEWASMTLDDKHRMDGPTPLIAAMRAFVASKLGDEVEVPAS